MLVCGLLAGDSSAPAASRLSTVADTVPLLWRFHRIHHAPGLVAWHRSWWLHHADLGLGYTFDDMPAQYVRLELRRMEMLWRSRRPMGLTSLPPEAMAEPPARRLAWLLGRAAIDGLPPAGIY